MFYESQTHATAGLLPHKWSILAFVKLEDITLITCIVAVRERAWSLSRSLFYSLTRTVKQCGNPIRALMHKTTTTQWHRDRGNARPNAGISS